MASSTNLSERGLIAVTWTGAGLGILFTGCRLAIRLTRLKRLLADDYAILAALFFLISNAILQTLQAPHLYYMVQTPQGGDIAHHAVMYVHYEFVIIALFWTVLWSVKAAFLAIFWKTTDQLPVYRRWWWAIAVFCTLAYIGCWLASALNCHPPSAYFKLGQCNKPIDQRGSLISISYSTAVDILSDLMIMTLALWIVWSTTISLRQKLALLVVFSLGGIIIAFAVVRAINILGRSYTDAVGLAVWGIAESSISVIVGCLPPFKTFLSRNNSTYASRYPPVYAQRTISQKRPVFRNASSDEVPLDPDYEMTRSRVRVSNGNARSNGSDEGEIRVTQGFVSVAMRQRSSQLTQTRVSSESEGGLPDEFALRGQLREIKKQLLMRYPKINRADGGKKEGNSILQKSRLSNLPASVSTDSHRDRWDQTAKETRIRMR